MVALAIALICCATLIYAPPALTQDNGAPAKPTGLSGTVAHDRVSLSWDDPQDGTITGYQVLRRDTNVHERGEFIDLVDDTGSATSTNRHAAATNQRTQTQILAAYRTSSGLAHAASKTRSRTESK